MRRLRLIEEINDRLRTDFLGARAFANDHPDAALLAPDYLDRISTTFIQDWSDKHPDLRLDEEQASAVGTFGQHVQVTARAGSGKTRTLVARVAFLIDHCGVAPDAILLLAFNKQAAVEMRTRLQAVLGDALPHVMTFHALAHAIVHPEQDLVFDDSGSGQYALSKLVQSLIDNSIQSDLLGPEIQTLMLDHFRVDVERVIDGRFELPAEDFVAHRRQLPREALKGHRVKSFGERTIANALFEHGIEYRYEANVGWFDGSTYRPDFIVHNETGPNIAIEYFGMSGDADYDAMSRSKRAYWEQRTGWELWEYGRFELASKGPELFTEQLIADLAAAGISGTRRTDQEIWHLIRTRAIDSFTKAVTQFVGRCRRRGLSPAEVRSSIARHEAASRAETIFLDIGAAMYENYLARIERDGLEDFDGLLARATAAIRDGQTRFTRDRGREQGDVARLLWIHIDEFQDFTPLFAALTDAMRDQNPQATYFCVGDDWQGINGFAGSDLRYFTRFDDTFVGSAKRFIRSNYRSHRAIIQRSNALMHGLGPGASAVREEVGSVRVLAVNTLLLSDTEEHVHGGDRITPAVLRVVHDLLQRNPSVVLLARRNGLSTHLPPAVSAPTSDDRLDVFLTHLQSFLARHLRTRITISNVHQYKGREGSAVVILDALHGTYPLVHPTWGFFRVFGDNLGGLIEEELRLFYVAMTRAEHELVILTDSMTPSDFISRLHKDGYLPLSAWPPAEQERANDARLLTIRVFNGYSVTKLLSEGGFKFKANSERKYWARVVPAEEHSLDRLRAEPWLKDNVRVEVVDHNGVVIDRLSARDADSDKD